MNVYDGKMKNLLPHKTIITNNELIIVLCGAVIDGEL